MNLIEKFSNNFKNTLISAYKLAAELNQAEIKPKHLLYGLLKQKGSIGTEVLTKTNINSEKIRQFVEKDKKSNNQTTPHLSLRVKRAIEKAIIIANSNEHKYIGTEHLLAALLEIKDDDLEKIFVQNKVNTKSIKQKIPIVLRGTSKFPDLTENFNLTDDIDLESIPEDFKMPEAPLSPFGKGPLLEFFATNLTNPTIQQKIDPVIAREEEIDRLIQILCRRTKNNPVLLGDPGVGKTAIVEGLAKKIINHQVPDVLINKKIMALDLGLLIAGTMYRGEFESRLKQIIDEVKQNSDLILFIDELHTIIGAGAASGSLDAANILKPALARGDIRCIGATTLEEYKKHIEKDAALERRFQSIIVNEPSTQTTVEILKGIKKNYENYHQVEITPQAIEAAVSLSNRYLQEKFLPDKAIDLIDEAASKVKVNQKSDGLLKKIQETEDGLEFIVKEKQRAIMTEKFDQAINLKNQEEKLATRLDKLRKKQQAKGKIILGKITNQQIAEMVSKITGIPLQELISQERKKIINLEKILSQKIIGQDEAIKTISESIRRSRAGLSPENRPLASFIFLGPSGVGKTELAKVLAQTIFQDKEALVRIDMSEFSERFNISKLIGAPAGYIGYREANKFTDQVRKKPYSIVLFDEIEKAHPDIFNLLLQILEDGHLTDAVGKKINFKNTIIIMTSNIGLENLNRQVIWGFENSKQQEIKYEEIKNQVLKDLKNKFKPEFLNRVDKTIVFKSLDIKSIEKIIRLQIEELNQRLAEQNLKLGLSSGAIKFLAQKSYLPQQGARAVRRNIQELIENLLAEQILQGGFKNTDSIKAKIKNKKIVLE